MAEQEQQQQQAAEREVKNTTFTTQNIKCLLTLEGAGGGTIAGIMDGGAGVAMAAGTMGALPAWMDRW